MKIIKIEIKRFRSINNLSMVINQSKNLTTICGQNNVGKTNIFRALNLFFEKKEFNLTRDVPEYKQMTGGAAVYPFIKITIKDKDDVWAISKNYDPKKIVDDSQLNYQIEGKKNNTSISEAETIKFLERIQFFFLQSVNVSFPEVINFLVDDKFLDIEFGQSRMSGKKATVKNALDTARNTLQEVLDDLTKSIDPNFKEFHESWGLKFCVPKNIKRFREIINNEIEFIINDDTQTEIHSKGAGLQRLGHILLNFRIIEKLIEKRKSCIVLIDEPDIFLHYKLQKKLFEKIKLLSEKVQIFITTHSPIFINPYDLVNLFLLELKVKDAYSHRKKKEGKILETKLIDLSKDDSVYTVKDILGIDDNDSFIVGNCNLLVEGSEDKKYLEELIRVFNLPMPNIISANGVTNYLKLLEYYDAISDSNQEKLVFKLLFDNDNAGREQFNKVISKVKKGLFKNITIECVFIIDAFNTTYKKNKPNVEIEDFIYPEIILELSNHVFSKKKGFSKIHKTTFMKKIKNESVRYRGVLDVLEFLKDEQNPNDGMVFSTKDSSFKGGIANIFNLKGNNIEINKIFELDNKYPDVKSFLKKLTTYD